MHSPSSSLFMSPNLDNKWCQEVRGVSGQAQGSLKRLVYDHALKLRKLRKLCKFTPCKTHLVVVIEWNFLFFVF